MATKVVIKTRVVVRYNFGGLYPDGWIQKGWQFDPKFKGYKCYWNGCGIDRGSKTLAEAKNVMKNWILKNLWDKAEQLEKEAKICRNLRDMFSKSFKSFERKQK